MQKSLYFFQDHPLEILCEIYCRMDPAQYDVSEQSVKDTLKDLLAAWSSGSGAAGLNDAGGTSMGHHDQFERLTLRVKERGMMLVERYLTFMALGDDDRARSVYCLF
jgi:hypothetical protein